MLLSPLFYRYYCTWELHAFPCSVQVSHVQVALLTEKCSGPVGLVVGVHCVCIPQGGSQQLSFVSGALLLKEHGGNNKTLLHHDKSKAKWRPVHCLPNVACERTYTYAMSSVLSTVRMHRKQPTVLICLFRNRVQIELSYKELHKVTIRGNVILVFLLHTYVRIKNR